MINAPSGYVMPFERLADTVATAVCPATSFTVTLSVRGPSLKFVVSQARETVSATKVR